MASRSQRMDRYRAKLIDGIVEELSLVHRSHGDISKFLIALCAVYEEYLEPAQDTEDRAFLRMYNECQRDNV